MNQEIIKGKIYILVDNINIGQILIVRVIMIFSYVWLAR